VKDPTQDLMKELDTRIASTRDALKRLEAARHGLAGTKPQRKRRRKRSDAGKPRVRVDDVAGGDGDLTEERALTP
jgi:hypothetical protein